MGRVLFSLQVFKDGAEVFAWRGVNESAMSCDRSNVFLLDSGRSFFFTFMFNKNGFLKKRIL